MLKLPIVFNKKNLGKAAKFGGKLALKELEKRIGEDEKVCVSTPFGSVCGGLDENEKVCVQTPFGGVCVDEAEED